eukprot:15462465-Alexandrium_andersonii.AAC.1
MAFTGDTMESTAPGANNRTDVHLVVFANSSSKGIVLGHAYHTTNVAPNTWSQDPDQAYPETRLLW